MQPASQGVARGGLGLKARTHSRLLPRRRSPSRSLRLRAASPPCSRQVCLWSCRVRGVFRARTIGISLRLHNRNRRSAPTGSEEGGFPRGPGRLWAPPVAWWRPCSLQRRRVPGPSPGAAAGHHAGFICPDAAGTLAEPRPSLTRQRCVWAAPCRTGSTCPPPPRTPEEDAVPVPGARKPSLQRSLAPNHPSHQNGRELRDQPPPRARLVSVPALMYFICVINHNVYECVCAGGGGRGREGDFFSSYI